MPPGRGFWVWLVGCAIVLGVAAVGGIDTWGVVHACLLSLVILGLASLLTQLIAAPRWLRPIVLAGLAVDFPLGPGLHFYLQNLPYPLRNMFGNDSAQFLHDHGTTAQVNLQARLLQRCEFINDWLISRILLLALPASLFALAICRLLREHAAACSMLL